MTPTCGAKTRAGTPCQLYPCKNGRCFLHGGKSTGPRTKAGRRRQIEAVTKSGYYARESVMERRRLRELIRESKEYIATLGGDPI